MDLLGSILNSMEIPSSASTKSNELKQNDISSKSKHQESSDSFKTLFEKVKNLDNSSKKQRSTLPKLFDSVHEASDTFEKQLTQGLKPSDSFEKPLPVKQGPSDSSGKKLEKIRETLSSCDNQGAGNQKSAHKLSYKCNICGKIFTVRSTFVAHKKNHKRNKKRGCHPFKKLEKTDLNKVHKATMPPKKESFQCKICNSVFIKKKSFRSHLNYHNKKLKSQTSIGKNMDEKSPTENDVNCYDDLSKMKQLPKNEKQLLTKQPSDVFEKQLAETQETSSSFEKQLPVKQVSYDSIEKQLLIKQEPLDAFEKQLTETQELSNSSEKQLPVKQASYVSVEKLLLIKQEPSDMIEEQLKGTIALSSSFEKQLPIKQESPNSFEKQLQMKQENPDTFKTQLTEIPEPSYSFEKLLSIKQEPSDSPKKQLPEVKQAYSSCGNLLSVNQKSLVSEMSYKCDICGRTFTVPSTYRNHKRNHKKNREIKRNRKPTKLKKKELFHSLIQKPCDSNENQLLSNQKPTDTQKTINNCTIYKCSICGSIHANILKFRKHVKGHPEYGLSSNTTLFEIVHESIYKCAICGKIFVEQSEFVNHDKLHRCKLNKKLAKKFKKPKVSESGKDVTLKITLPSDKEIVCCKICKKVFKRKSFINHKIYHEKRHEIPPELLII